MNLKPMRLALPAGVLAVALLVTACNETGDTNNESRNLDLDGATSAEVVVRMDVGELDVAGGADGMLDADFTYNVDEWEPEVDWNVTDGKGRLEIDQDGSGGINILDIDDVEYEWDLRLNDETPTALDVELGAGDSSLKLGTMNLTDLAVQTGAGDTTIDLTGDWANDLEASIDAGAGRLKVLLPSDTGVRIETDTGIVDVDNTGLTKDGDVYTNAAFGTSDATLTINIDAGVGEVELEVVE